MVILNRKGQGTVEYLVLLAIIVLGFIASLNFYKNKICDSFNRTADATGNCALAIAGGLPSDTVPVAPMAFP